MVELRRSFGLEIRDIWIHSSGYGHERRVAQSSIQPAEFVKGAQLLQFAALLTLALGIGANTTIFAWTNVTLLNPIPGIAHTSDLWAITRGVMSIANTAFNYPDYTDLRDRTHTFSGLTAFHVTPMSGTERDRPERVGAC
jgi:hypothetical protein